MMMIRGVKDQFGDFILCLFEETQIVLGLLGSEKISLPPTLSKLSEEVLTEAEASAEDEQSERNEPSEDDLSWNEAAGNCDEARPALRAMPQTSFLSEGGAATPLQQFHPQYGPSSFNAALSREEDTLLFRGDILESALVKDSGLSGA
ncbi:hypothetical protein VE00_10785 [Pseudogymnoascus sp. WSF 3629]|nr:hypothetical protein VE00_10785 [Pseudogymnoascus sp. WSF 3629]